MMQSNQVAGAPGRTAAFTIASRESVEGLARDATRRFQFRVPPRWRSPVLQNPFAAEAERRVIQWFEALGCTRAEVERARKFDAAGYVGIPFPAPSPEKTRASWRCWERESRAARTSRLRGACAPSTRSEWRAGTRTMPGPSLRSSMGSRSTRSRRQ